MKKLHLLLASIALLLIPLSTVWAASLERVLQRIDEDITTSDSFVDYMATDDGSTTESIISRLQTFESHFNQSANFYKTAAEAESDNDIRMNLQGLSENTTTFAESIAEVSTAFSEEDPDRLDEAMLAYDDEISSFNFNVASISDNYDLVDYSWLLYPFLVSLAISGLLFIASRGKPVLPAEALRNQYEFGLFKDSLWALGGSTISYVWYLLTPAGGTFYVLWGPIAFGYFYFIKNVFNYIRIERPKLSAAKQEQLAKVHEVLLAEKPKVAVPAIGSQAEQIDRV